MCRWSLHKHPQSWFKSLQQPRPSNSRCFCSRPQSSLQHLLLDCERRRYHFWIKDSLIWWVWSRQQRLQPCCLTFSIAYTSINKCWRDEELQSTCQSWPGQNQDRVTSWRHLFFHSSLKWPKIQKTLMGKCLRREVSDGVSWTLNCSLMNIAWVKSSEGENTKVHYVSNTNQSCSESCTE